MRITLRVKEQFPQLGHENRRIFIQKALNLNLNLTRIWHWVLLVLQKSDDHRRNDFILESVELCETSVDPWLENF